MCSEDRDSAQLERDLLNNRFKHLESERESERSSQTDRAREIRGLEVSLQGTEGLKLRIPQEQCRHFAHCVFEFDTPGGGCFLAGVFIMKEKAEEKTKHRSSELTNLLI